MSWRLSSERIFIISSNATPKKLGPGCYETTPHLGDHRTMRAPFNLGARAPKDPHSLHPGPGHYEPKPLPHSTACRSVFSSRTRRDIDHRTSVPSSTTYNHMTEWLPSPAPLPPPKALVDYRAPSGFVGQNVVGYRRDDVSGEWLPIKKLIHGSEYLGPTTYDPRYAPDGTTAVSLEMGANRAIYGSPVENPGPGAYTPTSSNLRIPPVIRDRLDPPPSTSIRRIYSGPRTWTSLANETASVFRFHGVRKLFPDVELTPDPGAYDIENPPKVPGNLAGFGVRGERPPLYSTDDNPGPGAYNVQKALRRKKPIGRKAIDRDDPSTIAPGPGTYEPHVEAVEARAHSVFASGTARMWSSATFAPGPGRYTPKGGEAIARKIHQARFEKYGNWIEQSKIENPSPDRYQSLRDYKGEGKTIPKSPRMVEEKPNGVPGPGAYQVRHGSLLKRSRNSSIPPFELV